MKRLTLLILLVTIWAAPFTPTHGQPLPIFWKTKINELCGTTDLETCFQNTEKELKYTGKPSQNREAIGMLKQLCIWQHVSSCFTFGKISLKAHQPKYQTALLGIIALQRACDLNHQTSCNRLNSFLGQHVVRALDVKVARDFKKLKQLCLERTAAACGILADTKIQKTELTRSKQNQAYKQAIELYEQACNHGSYISCLKLFDIYADFVEETRDFAKAMALLSALCEAGAVLECETLAFFYLTNQVVSRNLNRAKDLLLRACDGFVANACATLSDMALTGDYGERVDPATGYELRDVACFIGHGQACLNIGLDLETGDGAFDTADSKTAAGYYELACDLALGAGCAFLGQLTKDGLGVTRSLEGAQYLFDRGCFLEDADSCFRLGLLLQNEAVVANRKKAIDLSAALLAFQKGCALNSGEACTQAGYWLENGTSTAWFQSDKDLNRAISAYHKACTLNAPKGCFNLGLMHENGKARLRKNEKQAHIFFRKSCDLGLKEACLD